MTVNTLLQNIKQLSTADKQTFLSLLFQDNDIIAEIERMGYLKLSEKSFAFWNDSREDIYQDYIKNTDIE